MTECFDKIFQNIERTYEIKEGNLKSYRLFSETPSIFHQEEVKLKHIFFLFFTENIGKQNVINEKLKN